VQTPYSHLHTTVLDLLIQHVPAGLLGLTVQVLLCASNYQDAHGWQSQDSADFGHHWPLRQHDQGEGLLTEVWQAAPAGKEHQHCWSSSLQGLWKSQCRQWAFSDLGDREPLLLRCGKHLPVHAQCTVALQGSPLAGDSRVISSLELCKAHLS
jgi:hypothetical protein